MGIEQCVGKFVPYLYIFSVQVRHATGVVLSGVADVFEEDSGKFGQSCSMLVGLGCASVVVVVVGEVFWGGAVHVWMHFQAYTLGV